MRLFSARLDEREAAILDPTRCAYFGSWVLHEGDVTVTPLGTWWTGLELAEQPPGTMGASEIDRKLAGY